MGLSTIEIVMLTLIIFGPLLMLAAGAVVIKRIFDGRIDAVGDEIAAKVRAAVMDAVEEALPRVREEVEAGVRSGANESLPQVREQVRDGVSEALAKALSGGLLGKAGEELVRKGGGVLDALLRPRTDDD